MNGSIEAFPGPSERRYYRKRTLNDDEQAEQVEGTFGDWPLCLRCNLRAQPWRDQANHWQRKHYLCPGSDRKLLIRPYCPQGQFSSFFGDRKPSYTGTIEGARVLEVYTTKGGKHTYVYRTTLDVSVPLRHCGKFFKSRPLALRDAQSFLAKNMKWTHEREPELTNEDLASLSAPKRSEDVDW